MRGNFPAAVLLAALLSGCSTNPVPSVADRSAEMSKIELPVSYLEAGDPMPDPSESSSVKSPPNQGGKTTRQLRYKNLKSIQWQVKKPKSVALPFDFFPADNQLTVSAEKMPLRDFIHYVFGEVLNVNYVLDETIEILAEQDEGVTLSFTDAISSRDLLQSVNELFGKRSIGIKYGNKTFFIFRNNQASLPAPLVIGIGKNSSDVPDTMQTILQVVPIKFGIKIGMERTLQQITNAKINPDFAQSAIFIEGKRDEIIKVLELIEMLDTPAMRGRHIGLIEFAFLDPKTFSSQALTLLSNEGIEAAIGKPANRNLVLVPLEQLNALAVFATNQFLLDRVQYWAQVMDVPMEGPNKQFFVYHPQYARSIDLHKTVAELLGLQVADSASDEGADGGSTGNAPSTQRRSGVGGDDIRLIVDEKANVLVFYASGQRYRSIMPLLKKIDVMPKQVMLDITIAEVSLKDEFKYGVEWALNRGEVTLTTQGAFGATGVGGIGLLVDGSEGPLTANMLSTNSLVNVLSQPTLMVRDGVSASINVGSQISVVGQTTQDPINGERQTTTSVYRNTGVTVTVTPTVNAAGIVVMEVDQNISNSVPGTNGAGGNPDIFERSIKTEVVASSGQTVMLGGLISENLSAGGSGTPGLSKIPIIGHLFQAESQSKDRTELIMLITPRVIQDTSGWEPLMKNFRQGLKYLRSAQD